MFEYTFDPKQYENIENLFLRLHEKNNNWTQELFDIGILLLRSQDLNFAQQGRPDRWIESEAAKKRHGMTLVDSGRLRSSVSVIGDVNSIFNVNPYSLYISTSVSYAKYVAEKWLFLLIQDEDITNIEKILIRSLEKL